MLICLYIIPQISASFALNIIQSQIWIFFEHIYSRNFYYRSVTFSKNKQYTLIKRTDHILERSQRRDAKNVFICFVVPVCSSINNNNNNNNNNWNIAERIFIKFDIVMSYLFQTLLQSNKNTTCYINKLHVTGSFHLRASTRQIQFLPLLSPCNSSHASLSLLASLSL